MASKHPLRHKLQTLFYYTIPHNLLSKMYFYAVLKRKLNLKKPQTFNEKIQWLKLKFYPNSPLAIQCSDKYAVREYVEKSGLADTLNELIGVWERVEEIPWDNLPEKFALKCTHGCAYNIICSDKTMLDIKKAKKQLKKWMKEKYGCFLVEPHYNKIKPRIICEKYLEEDITDYKFYCFNGKPEFLYISKGFGEGVNVTTTFFDMEGKKASFMRSDYPEDPNATLPKNFEKMSEMCKLLARDFPFVRVDLFEINDKIYFSELTFTPTAGLTRFKPVGADEEIGKKLDLKSQMETKLGE